MPSNPAELMHRGESAENDGILHRDMTGQRAVVRKNHVAPHHAVMRDVAVGEEVVPAADDGFSVRRSAAIHGDEFPEFVVVTDFEIRGLALVFEVLRTLPDAREGEEP